MYQIENRWLQNTLPEFSLEKLLREQFTENELDERKTMDYLKKRIGGKYGLCTMIANTIQVLTSKRDLPKTYFLPLLANVRQLLDFFYTSGSAPGDEKILI